MGFLGFGGNKRKGNTGIFGNKLAQQAQMPQAPPAPMMPQEPPPEMMGGDMGMQAPPMAPPPDMGIGPSPEMMPPQMPPQGPPQGFNPFSQQMPGLSGSGPFGMPQAPGMPNMNRFKPQGMGGMMGGMGGMMGNMPGMGGKVGLPGLPGINPNRLKPQLPPGLGFLGKLFGGGKKKPVPIVPPAVAGGIGPSQQAFQPTDY